MRGSQLLLAALGIAALLPVQLRAADCGCDRSACHSCGSDSAPCYRKAHGCCLHRHCHQCCQQPAAPAAAPRGAPLPPAGPVYESMPMARAMPMMAMPVMMASYPAMPRGAYEEAPRPRESNCASSASEIELLKERFDRLHTRVNTLQDSLETQTAILRRITDKLDELDKKVTR